MDDNIRKNMIRYIKETNFNIKKYYLKQYETLFYFFHLHDIIIRMDHTLNYFELFVM